ncbi:MAG: 30S ribosomal protein S6 [Clostridiales bacterium 43-6]|nr:MAG: 30S ribosomal protein S6 [Clostridiales bacterium 43-6]
MPIINTYETVMVFSLKSSEEGIKELKDKFVSLIEKNGTIISVDEWGKRRLAYLIDDENEGYYVLVNFTSEPTFITELERIYKITDGVLRNIVIKKDPAAAAKAQGKKPAAVKAEPVAAEATVATEAKPAAKTAEVNE